MSAAWEVRNKHADLMHIWKLHSSTAFRNILLPTTTRARHTERIIRLSQILLGNIGWLLQATAKRIVFSIQYCWLIIRMLDTFYKHPKKSRSY